MKVEQNARRSRAVRWCSFSDRTALTRQLRSVPDIAPIDVLIELPVKTFFPVWPDCVAFTAGLRTQDLLDPSFSAAQYLNLGLSRRLAGEKGC